MKKQTLRNKFDNLVYRHEMGDTLTKREKKKASAYEKVLGKHDSAMTKQFSKYQAYRRATGDKKNSVYAVMEGFSKWLKEKNQKK